MRALRFDLRKDWLFYAFVVSYALLIGRMTIGLWFGDGINIFATYSPAVDATQMLMDANKIYWSKTCFLFGTLALFSLNIDYRFAVACGAAFWSASLIGMFTLTPILGVTLAGALALCVQQVWRRQVLDS